MAELSIERLFELDGHEHARCGHLGRTIVIEGGTAAEEARTFTQIFARTGVALSAEDTVIRLHRSPHGEDATLTVYDMPIAALMKHIAANGLSICHSQGTQQ